MKIIIRLEARVDLHKPSALEFVFVLIIFSKREIFATKSFKHKIIYSWCERITTAFFKSNLIYSLKVSLGTNDCRMERDQTLNSRKIAVVF